MVMDKPTMSFIQRNPRNYTFWEGTLKMSCFIAIDLFRGLSENGELIKSCLSEPLENLESSFYF